MAISPIPLEQSKRIPWDRERCKTAFHVTSLIAFDCLTYSLAFTVIHAVTPIVGSYTLMETISINNVIVIFEFGIFFLMARTINIRMVLPLFFWIIGLYTVLVPLGLLFLRGSSLGYLLSFRFLMVILGCIYAIVFRVIVYDYCAKGKSYGLYGLCYVIGAVIFGKQAGNLYLWDLRTHGYPVLLIFYLILMGILCFWSGRALVQRPGPIA